MGLSASIPDKEGEDEPDIFYECSSEGFGGMSEVMVVQERLSEGFEIGDTYFEDAVNPQLKSLDLIVDDLYHHLENHCGETGQKLHE